MSNYGVALTLQVERIKRAEKRDVKNYFIIKNQPRFLIKKIDNNMGCTGSFFYFDLDIYSG